MKIALLQMEIAAGDKERNIRHAIEMLDRAAGNADVIVMPEMWTTGYDLHDLKAKATHPGDELMQRLSSFSRFRGITLVAGSMPVEFSNHNVYNTSVVFGPDGKPQAFYRKVHLFSHLAEIKLFKAGNQRICTDICGVTCGLSICYDLRFPELFRSLSQDGATLIFLPASWPWERIHPWNILTQARAIENEIFMCAVNGVGSYKGVYLCGHSMFVLPTGENVIQGDDKENIYYAEYQEDEVMKQRDCLSVWPDRRGDVYRS